MNVNAATYDMDINMKGSINWIKKVYYCSIISVDVEG